MKLFAIVFSELAKLAVNIRRARMAFGTLADGAEALVEADGPLGDVESLPDGVVIPEAIQSRLRPQEAITVPEDSSNGASTRGRRKAKK